MMDPGPNLIGSWFRVGSKEKDGFVSLNTHGVSGTSGLLTLIKYLGPKITR